MNLGAAVLRVDSTVVVGPDRLEFQIREGGGPFELTPGQKRGATIRFAPLTAGAKRAWLVAYSNTSSGKPDSLLLKATADPGAVLELRIADPVINFGDVRSGVASDSYDTTFENFFFNSGTEPLEVRAAVSGPDAALFPGTNWFETLEPGTGMPLTIGFFADTLTGWGWKTAYIVIVTNTPKGLDTVRLMAKIIGTMGVNDEGSGDALFSIVPNPTSGSAEISVLPSAGELGLTYTMSIVDAAGTEMRRETGRFTKAGITATIKHGDLPAGRYFVTVTTTRGVRSHAVTFVR
jgi:hypothetical protein